MKVKMNLFINQFVYQLIHTKMKLIHFVVLLFVLCDIPMLTTPFLFYTENSPGRPPNYSYSDSWTAEELWPKEKSFIHVKLLRPSPKAVPVWELRNIQSYLSDPSLDFDSPFENLQVNSCLIEYKPVRTADSEGLVQVQISGRKCLELPFESLQHFNNLTHLVVRNTGLVNLTKFIFGAAKMDKLNRIDIIDNQYLKLIQARAFDGLSRLNYLSLINNNALNEVNQIEVFVGLKNLEELIWVNNGYLDSKTFSTLIRASSVRILPNLIHLHLSGPELDLDQNQIKTDFDDFSVNGDNLGVKQNLVSGLKLNKDEFNSLTQIKYLQLTNCDIKFLHPLALFPLKDNLIGLNLAGNKRLLVGSLKQALVNAFQVNSTFTVIDKLDISGLSLFKTFPKDLLSVISKTKVSELYLNDIAIRELSIGDIPPMPRLKVLHLESTLLESIEEGALSTLEELVKLSFKGNFLKTIPPTLVSDLPNLEFLDLSGYKNNRTSFEIPRKTFIGTSLKEVNLSYKLLDPLPRNAFLGLFKMQRFHLRGCGLKWVEYLTFFPLKSIIYIDLSENDELISTLRETHEDSFFGLEAIQMLRMSRCNLTSRDINDDSIFKRIHEHVQLLDLSHNLIDRITSETFSNFTELQHLDLSHNSIKPWANFSVFAKNLDLITLDISNNSITHMTSSMLEDLHRVKNLSFALNPLTCDCQSQIVMEWLNENTGIHYLHNRHPLYSKSQYFCFSPDGNRVNFRSFFDNCKTLSFGSTRVSLALLSGITSALLLLALVILIFAFIYHSTLHSLLTGVEEDNYDYQYDAFVSYNVNDSDWVFKQLVPNLESGDSEVNRIKLCVYDRDFIAGRPISECILESIKTSRKVILVISNNFIKSPWCRFETDLAHNTLTDQNRDGLIMVKLEDLENEKVAPQLHFLLKTRIYLQWNDNNVKEQEVFWRKLRRALGFNIKKQQPIWRWKKILEMIAPGKDKSKSANAKTIPEVKDIKTEIIECSEKKSDSDEAKLKRGEIKMKVKVPIAS